MAQNQNINLSVSGIYTSMNDMNGLPPGALDVADNVESRYKNLIEPRRGFVGLSNSIQDIVHYLRQTNFYINGVDVLIALNSADVLQYYDGTNPWPSVPGDFSTNILPPNALNGKCRFFKAGQNLYLTAQDGMRSLASGSGSEMIRAGVPKGLNIEAETNGDTSGFFDNNTVLSTTGKITNASPTLTNLASSTGIATGMYVTGIEVDALKIIQDLTYTSLLFGAAGNAITVTYTGGASLVVSVVGTAISVQLNTGVSTATQVRTAVLAFGAAAALVSVAVTGTGSNVQVAAAVVSLAGGLDNTIPSGTTVLSITNEAPLIVETGNTTAGSTSVSNLAALTGIVAGVVVSATGIPTGAKVVSTSGAGPYTAVLDQAAYQTQTGVNVTFSSALSITMSANALSSLSSTAIAFYNGAQVGYRALFGRIETDINGNTLTRLGSPTALAIATNTSPYSTDNTITLTLPKNASKEISFVQLYRSPQTASVSITPLDQYNLVYEATLVAGDFTARVVTITDDVPDSLVGIPLYTGSDQEGALQANDPPPMAWDGIQFRDFLVLVNVVRPTTTSFTIVSVGSPSGIQNGDTITIAGSFVGTSFSSVYIAAGAEVQSTKHFKVYSSGTPSQNIADTAASLIRVINYDQSCPVHAILLSGSSDLPGQILLEADNPSYDTFSVNASAHQSAYDPTLSNLTSDINSINNGVGLSKLQELEAVPATNLKYAGSSNSNILRAIPTRDYVYIIKEDGIYRGQGLTPADFIISPFDLTTKIIGADTAVALNSAAWMLSNQGIVSISDGGVDAKSIPIDDQLNALIQSYLNNLKDTAFAVGYESDRKYILAVPDGNTQFCSIEYNFNYVTHCFTTWSRDFHTGFIHSSEDKLYVARATQDDQGVSKERKNGNYTDYVDESIAVTITVITGLTITLDSVAEVSVGDILYQSSTIYSVIVDTDLATNTIVIQSDTGFTVAAAEVLKSFLCEITWKQVFGSNPAFAHQFSEGIALFKRTRFNEATLKFLTDYSNSTEETTIPGQAVGAWGLFPWGGIPWGGSNSPRVIRFLIPQNKQQGSYILPTLRIEQGYSNFAFQGLSISYNNVSQEVGGSGDA